MLARPSKTAEEKAYIERVRLARAIKFHKQKPVYTFLEVPQEQYKHWETSRPMPREYIPKFCLITESDIQWLLSGEGKAPSVPSAEAVYPKQRRGRKSKQAAA